MFKTEPAIEQAVDEYFDEKPKQTADDHFNAEVKISDDVIPVEKPRRGRKKKDPAISGVEKEIVVNTPKTNGIDPAAAKALDRVKEAAATPQITSNVLEFDKAKQRANTKAIESIVAKVHALFGSPSTLSRTEKCAGWIAFGKDIPEPGQSESAAEGDEFHDYMEKASPEYLANNHKKVAAILKACTLYADMEGYVWDALAKLNDIWNRFREKHAGCKHYFELKVKLSDDCFGTSDVVFVGKNIKTGKMSILVIDWKYGLGVYVSAHENLQGIAYLLATAKTLEIKPEDIGVGMVIIGQVRLNEEWEKEQYIVKGEAFPQWEKQILGIVASAKAIYNGEQPIEGNLHAGDHCRFCKAQGVCPARKEATFDSVTVTASDLPIEEQVKKLTLDEQVAIFKKKSHIEDFLKAVASNLHQAFLTGVAHDDLKLIKTNGRREWKYDDEVIATELTNLGLTGVWKKKVIGLTQAEKELGKDKGKIAYLLETGEGKIELVEASDKRPALKIDELKELPHD